MHQKERKSPLGRKGEFGVYGKRNAKLLMGRGAT
jgi:hypothetical protein